MAGSTYSSNLKIELMTTGENSGTWGNITNTNLGTALEQAVVGLGNPDYLSDANLTITITNSNAAQAARALVLNVTSSFGSLSTTRELVVPTIQKQYIVQNNTTGGQSITVKTSAGTGITVPNGRKAHLYVDGTNVIQMFDFVDINGGTIDGTAIGGASAAAAAFTTLTASGATTLNGAVALGDAAGDLITVPGRINSNLLFTDATYDIGASGATRPRDMFLSRNLTVGGTLTLAGGVNLNGNVTVGDSSADTLTINSTITSNLIFTDNTYDIGASGATRPRNLFLAGNATVGGAQTLTGALTVDSTTDSSSITTGSIQTDGGLGVAKALFVGTTANIAGVATFSAGTALLPAITTSGDTNTGIFFPAADTIAFAEGGAESMRIDSAGNVGIGSLSPGARLYVSGTDGTNLIETQATGGGLVALRPDGVNGNAIRYGGTGAGSAVLRFLSPSDVERMRISATGGLSIGTTTDPGDGGLITTGNVTLGNATTDTVTVNGYMGVGGAASAGSGLRVASTALTGTAQFGVNSSPVGTSAATSTISAFFAAPGTAASAFTTADTFGLYVNNLSKGAGSTVTRQSGVTVADQTQGTSNFGIQSLVSSGTNKWNIYASGTAQNYFAGNVQFAAGSAAAPALTRFGDDNTGIFFPAADTIAFSEGGAEAMRIDSSGNLGIGTTTPNTLLTMVGTTGKQAILRLQAASGSAGGFKRTIVNFRDDTGSAGYDIVGYGDNNNALAFSSVVSNTPTIRMTLDSSGNFLLNGTQTPTSATASFALFNGTAPTGSVTDGVVLYAQDVSSSSELRVRDEAGNVTTLSPHNFELIPEGPSEDMAWSYYSERDGKRINVDMLKAIRLLEKLSGEKLVYSF
jgi:hypothetical protein